MIVGRGKQIIPRKRLGIIPQLPEYCWERQKMDARLPRSRNKLKNFAINSVIKCVCLLNRYLKLTRKEQFTVLNDKTIPCKCGDAPLDTPNF